MATEFNEIIDNQVDNGKEAFLEAAREMYNVLFEAELPSTNGGASVMEKLRKYQKTILSIITELIQAGTAYQNTTERSTNLINDPAYNELNEFAGKIAYKAKVAENKKLISPVMLTLKHFYVNREDTALYTLAMSCYMLNLKDIVSSIKFFRLPEGPDEFAKNAELRKQWINRIDSNFGHLNEHRNPLSNLTVKYAAQQFANAWARVYPKLIKFLVDNKQDIVNTATAAFNTEGKFDTSDIKAREFVPEVAGLDDDEPKATGAPKTDRPRLDEVAKNSERNFMAALFEQNAASADLIIQLPVNLMRAIANEEINIGLMENTFRYMKCRAAKAIYKNIEKLPALKTLIDPNALGHLDANETTFDTTILDADKFDINEVTCEGLPNFNHPELNSGIITFKYKENASVVKTLIKAIAKILDASNITCAIKVGEIEDAAPSTEVDTFGEETPNPEAMGHFTDKSLDILLDNDAVGFAALCPTSSDALAVEEFAKTLPKKILGAVPGAMVYTDSFIVGRTAKDSSPTNKNVVVLKFTDNEAAMEGKIRSIINVAVGAMSMAVYKNEDLNVTVVQRSPAVEQSIQHDMSDGQRKALITLLQSHQSADRNVNRAMFRNQNLSTDALAETENFVSFSPKQLHDLLVKSNDDTVGLSVYYAVTRYLNSRSIDIVKYEISIDQSEEGSFTRSVARMAAAIYQSLATPESIAKEPLTAKETELHEAICAFANILLESGNSFDIGNISNLANNSIFDDDDDEEALPSDGSDATISEEPADGDETAPTEAEQPEPTETPDVQVPTAVDPAVSEKQIGMISEKIADKINESGLINFIKSLVYGAVDIDSSFEGIPHADEIKEILQSSNANDLNTLMNQKDGLMQAIAYELAQKVSGSDDPPQAAVDSADAELAPFADQITKIAKDSAERGMNAERMRANNPQTYMQQIGSVFGNRNRMSDAMAASTERKRKEVDDLNALANAKSDAEKAARVQAWKDANSQNGNASSRMTRMRHRTR